MSVDELLAGLKLQVDADPTARASLITSLLRWIKESGKAEAQMLDAIATRLAYGYSTKQWDYAFCSVLMRRLKDFAAQSIRPSLFWELFVAFDAGEFYHKEDESRDVEPSELHTRPMVEAIIRRLGDRQDGEG